MSGSWSHANRALDDLRQSIVSLACHRISHDPSTYDTCVAYVSYCVIHHLYDLYDIIYVQATPFSFGKPVRGRIGDFGGEHVRLCD
jgi:hypothetical protein